MTLDTAAAAKPRVLLIAHEVKDQGGMERALVQLLQQCQDDVDFVVLSMVLSPELRPLVSEWHRVWAPRRPFPLRFVWFWVAAGRRARHINVDLVQTMGAIVPNRVDIAGVVHCHTAYRDLVGSVAPGTPFFRRISGGVGHLLGEAGERWTYRPRRSRMLTASSNGLKRELGRYFPGLQISVASLGVDAERFRPDERVRRDRTPFRSGSAHEMVAAFVGGDWYRKGLPIAIAGVAAAVERGGDVALWVAGPGQQGSFVEQARRLGIEDRLRFLGTPDEIEPVFQGADVFLLPSAYESFSLVSHEAAACGIPVIATGVHGVSELIEDGAAGTLVDSLAEEVGAALYQLWEDPSLRLKKGAVARQRAEHLTWTQYGRAYAAIYSELLTGGSRAVR